MHPGTISDRGSGLIEIRSNQQIATRVEPVFYEMNAIRIQAWTDILVEEALFSDVSRLI